MGPKDARSASKPKKRTKPKKRVSDIDNALTAAKRTETTDKPDATLAAPTERASPPVPDPTDQSSTPQPPAGSSARRHKPKSPSTPQPPAGSSARRHKPKSHEKTP